MAKVQLARWGNSTALRLPKAVVDELGLKPGAALDLVVEGRDIRLRAAPRPHASGIPIYTLEELVAEMERLGPENVPETVEWGPDRGSEIIEEDDYSTGKITLEDLIGRKDDAGRG